MAKRMTVFCGNFGSGKTELAMAYAKQLAKQGERVTLVDMDFVNPYFTSSHQREELEGMGVRLIGPRYSTTGVDVPSLSPEVFSVFIQKDAKVIFDLGGDPIGAVAMGSLASRIEQDGGAEMLFVLNPYRPLVRDTKSAKDLLLSIQQESQRKTIEITRANADIARREKEAELAEKEIALKERKLDAEIRKQADAMKYKAEKEAEADLIRRQRDAEAAKYEAIQQAEARKAEAEAIRFAMEQEAEGIRAKGLAEAEAIEKKAEAQKKMGEASILEMYLQALPEVVKNAAAPLSQTDKIVMYGDGNPTKVVRDVMNSASQIMEGMKESTGLDLTQMLNSLVAAKKPAEDD